MEQDCRHGVEAAASSVAPNELTLEAFHALQGSVFELAGSASVSHSAELESAVPAKGKTFPGKRAPFSLVFRIPGLKYLPQGLYKVKHPDLGLRVIFLVPVISQDSMLRMEAIFN